MIPFTAAASTDLRTCVGEYSHPFLIVMARRFPRVERQSRGARSRQEIDPVPLRPDVDLR